jgi:hypothetical protein
MNKTILLASFIFPERVDWFIGYLEAKFGITKDKVFCYNNLDDESKVIITFKLVVDTEVRLNLKDLFPSGIQIHKKGNALYSINALNKLIDETIDGEVGNIDYKSIIIDWDKYQNKMILINGGKLSILNILRVF